MYPHFVRGALLIGLAGLLNACAGGTEKNEGSGDDFEAFIVSGHVGDASLVGASITVADANGATVFETVSGQTAQYEAQIPAGSPMPLTITAEDGEDLVTGGATEFDLVAVAFSNSQTVNISPLSTLGRQWDCC